MDELEAKDPARNEITKEKREKKNISKLMELINFSHAIKATHKMGFLDTRFNTFNGFHVHLL
jgi:hypothetical protein